MYGRARIILWRTSLAWNGCGVIPWYWKAFPVWHRKSALTGCGPMWWRTAATRPCRICLSPNGKTRISPSIPRHRSRATPLPSTSSKAGRKHGTIALRLTRACRKRGWPLTGRITILSTRPRWTAKPRWRTSTVHSTLTVPPTSPATAFPFPTLWC